MLIQGYNPDITYYETFRLQVAWSQHFATLLTVPKKISSESMIGCDLWPIDITYTNLQCKSSSSSRLELHFTLKNELILSLSLLFIHCWCQERCLLHPEPITGLTQRDEQPFTHIHTCGRKPEHPEETHTGTRRACEPHTGRPGLTGSNLKPACYESANHCTTTPLCLKISLLKYCIFSVSCVRHPFTQIIREKCKF